MSALGSPSERGAALREQHAQEQELAARRKQEMAGKDKSPTGIVRGTHRFDDAKAALGALNRKLDEAIDEVRIAFQREAQMNQAENMTRQDDAERAPILDGRKQVRS